jgi:hypothetical protein
LRSTVNFPFEQYPVAIERESNLFRLLQECGKLSHQRTRFVQRYCHIELPIKREVKVECLAGYWLRADSEVRFTESSYLDI